MSYDGVVLRAVSLELQDKLLGARIDKIHQPTKNEIHLLVRQPGQNYRLVFSAHPQEAGLYLTSQARVNPLVAPLFCMVLRKHLEGGRIVSFEQEGLDRVLVMTCQCLDELGDKINRQLIIEIMGKHSNIILVTPGSNKIIDSANRVSNAMSRYRAVLPGLEYFPPPPQDKILPWVVREEAFFEKVVQAPLNTSLKKVLLNTYSGLSPQTITELLYRAELTPEMRIEFCGLYELSRLWQIFHTAAQNIEQGTFEPDVVLAEGRPLTFSALALSHYTGSEHRRFPTMNEGLDFFFSHKKMVNIHQHKKSDLAQVVKKELDRCEKKAGLQRETVEQAQHADQYRIWGELLMANLHQLTPGTQAAVDNFYDPEGKKELIPLDVLFSPKDNAVRYFNKYQKLKNAARQARIHLDETQTEIDYLSSVVAALENAQDLVDLEEITEELRETSYLKPLKQKYKASNKVKVARQLPKVILDGWEVYYGKNNRQNDLLTMKTAKAEDIWLHTKDIPGSHVVIKKSSSPTPPEAILEKAALIAAYFSQARGSAKVPVDYTLRKHVWKPKGAKPGFVHYENQRTVFVTPSEDVLASLLRTVEE